MTEITSTSSVSSNSFAARAYTSSGTNPSVRAVTALGQSLLRGGIEADQGLEHVGSQGHSVEALSVLWEKALGFGGVVDRHASNATNQEECE